MRFMTTAIAAMAFACGTATAADHIISTLAGGGSTPVANGIAATQADIGNVRDVAIDKLGNVWIASASCLLLKLDTTGHLYIVAGNGQATGEGTANYADDVAATSTPVCPETVDLDPAGNPVVWSSLRIRKVDLATGRIVTLAGSGYNGFAGDGGNKPLLARFYQASGVAFDAAGNMFVADYGNQRVRKIASGGAVSTIAGNGTTDVVTEGPATLSSVAFPDDVLIDANGDLLVVANGSVRRIGKDGMIRTIAGGGAFEFDNVARSVWMDSPHGIALDKHGNLYIQNNTATFMTSPSGAWTVIAGGEPGETYTRPYFSGYEGDGGPASRAIFSGPEAIAVDATGNVLIADTMNRRVRRIAGPIAAPVATSSAGAFVPTGTALVPPGAHMFGIAVADINGDGRRDILAMTHDLFSAYDPAKDRIHVYPRKADGTLGAAYSWPTTVVPTGVETGYINRDATADVVVGTSNKVLVFPITPAGTPGPTVTLPMPATMSELGPATLIDVDNDRDLDVVAHAKDANSWTMTNVVTWFNDGNGNFPRVTRQADLPSQGGFVDLDGDGAADMLSPETESCGFSVSIRDVAADHFQTPNLVSCSDYLPNARLTGLRAMDVDGDGLLDIVGVDATSGYAWLVTFEATGAGVVVFTGTRPLYKDPGDVLLSDMDNDGRADVIVSHSRGAVVGYLHNIALPGGGRGFDAPAKTMAFANWSSNGEWGRVLATDANGDGCRDLLVGSDRKGITVLEGQACRRVKYGPDSPRAPGTVLNKVTVQATQPAPATVWQAMQSFAKRNWANFMGGWAKVRGWFATRI